MVAWELKSDDLRSSQVQKWLINPQLPGKIILGPGSIQRKFCKIEFLVF